jgi:polyhydroxyalkanoate synthesis regulator phasin
VLAQLAEEVSANRSLVTDKLPGELERKNGRLMSVRNVLRSPMATDSDLHEQTNQVNQLNSRVKELEAGAYTRPLFSST